MASLQPGITTFDLIPTEIILLIFREITDFVSLDNLLQVSPRVSAIFSLYPISITEHVLVSSPMTSRIILRQFHEDAVIRSPIAHYANLRQFGVHFWSKNANIVNLAQCYAGRNASEVDDGLRDMVHVAAHIQRLACACLSTMLGNLHTVVHSDPVFPESRVIAGTKKPSWVEEYRVYRALWHLQIFSDLETASGPNVVIRSSYSRWGGWDWPSDDTTELPWGWYFMARRVDRFVRNEVRQVSRVLQIMTGAEKHAARSTLMRIPLRTSSQSAHPFDGPVWCPPPLPRNTKVDRLWCQSISFSRLQAPSMPHFSLFQDHVTGNLFPGLSHDPLLKKSMCLHDLGMFLWDRWRLCCVGLVFTQRSERESMPEGDDMIRDPDAYVAKTGGMERWKALMEKACEL